MKTTNRDHCSRADELEKQAWALRERLDYLIERADKGISTKYPLDRLYLVRYRVVMRWDRRLNELYDLPF